ncbi:hypothetical protein DFJ73DRAFT_251171 [Zopfochytrium polystomum]|nr:hypothetical protein DFJ73DRAFT_251171 [Zopfochytrium polystomum]
MLDIAEFIMGSLPQASPAELRIFATSLPSHPLVDQLAGVIDADLVLKSSPSGSPSLITRENFNAKAATQRYSQEFLTGFEAKLKALQQEPDAVRSRREFLLIEFLQKIARFNVYNDKEFRPAFADLPGLNEGHVLVEAYENSLSFRFASYVTTKLRRRAFEELSSGAVYNFPNGEDSSASHLSVRATTSPQRMEPIKIKGEQRSGNDQVAVPAPTLPLRSASDASTQMAGLTDGRDSPAGSEGKVPPPALSGQAQTQWPTTTKGDRSNWESGSNWSSDADSFAPEAGVSTLWVGNFKDETTLEDLKGFFRSISFVRIRLSKNSPDKRPCAYVDILEEDMERALRLSGEVCE